MTTVRLWSGPTLAYAVDLMGMNSSLTPLFAPVQMNRPFPWLNWQAKRVLEMVKGSYLFSDDPKRIIQDPEALRTPPSARARPGRPGPPSDRSVRIQLNSLRPQSGGARPRCRSERGLGALHPAGAEVLRQGRARTAAASTASSSPTPTGTRYPIGNDVEAFTSTLANMDIAVVLRMDRFSNTFFTVIRPADVIPAAQLETAAPFRPVQDRHRACGRTSRA